MFHKGGCSFCACYVFVVVTIAAYRNIKRLDPLRPAVSTLNCNCPNRNRRIKINLKTQQQRSSILRLDGKRRSGRELSNHPFRHFMPDRFHHRWNCASYSLPLLPGPIPLPRQPRGQAMPQLRLFVTFTIAIILHTQPHHQNPPQLFWRLPLPHLKNIGRFCDNDDVHRQRCRLPGSLLTR